MLGVRTTPLQPSAVRDEMARFSTLRLRLVATVFFAIAPALVLIYVLGRDAWPGFAVGLLALAAAWFGGERYVLRQLRALCGVTRKLAAGDLEVRTGMANAEGELGELARTFDGMAEALHKRAQESQLAEKSLLSRAMQQTAVAAVGQYSLVTNDLHELFNQTVVLVAQTLDVEMSEVLELSADGQELSLVAGVGWKKGVIGTVIASNDRTTQPGFTLNSGEPVVVEDLRKETRFQPTSLLMQHGAVCGVTVAISPREFPYGVLGVYSRKRRTFTGEEVHFLLAIATTLGLAVERRRAEGQRQKLAVFAQLNPIPAMELAEDGSVTYFNDAALKLALSVGKDHPRYVLPPNTADVVAECLVLNRSNTRLETQVEKRTLSWLFHPVVADRVVHCYVEDITDRLSLEAQLRQSQKMESIGQLASGVAHDFNNMLTIIQGHSGLLMAKPDLTPQMFDSAQAVYYAAERAAGLTRQLLMFSRKNVMQIRALDLRELVGNTTKMLKRLLGETVTLEFTPPPQLPMVTADSGMIEQIVMNLCVNARDAMPKGGTLAINLDNVLVDDAYVQIRPDARVGNFVRLRVTDTGTGMDPATMSRIFEPFFTTKEVGKGTGLGLATVYGIVKQHGGWLEVSSELGKGSTFAVYLEASAESAKDVEEQNSPTAFVRGGSETILVVEDEAVLRDMAQMILTGCGYNVLQAGNGREAVKVWSEHRDKIDLILTDMVMPGGVSGTDLAEQLLAERPDVKVIFATGYTVDSMNTQFFERKNTCFLQKPYTRVSLANTVRQVLDGVPQKQSVAEAAAASAPVSEH